MKTPTADDAPATHDSLTRRFKDALRLQPRPLLVDHSGAIPGASIWTGARLWRDQLRALGLEPGDRITLALPPCRAFLLALLGAWRAGLTVCPIDPSDHRAIEHLGSRAHIAEDAAAATSTPTLAPDPAGAPLPSAAAPELRASDASRSPGIALILSTSGSSGRPKRVALSHANIRAQLESHTHALEITPDDVALSVLPWRHAFGLLVDALPALLSGATLIVDPGAGRDARAILQLASHRRVTRVSMTPLQVRRWLDLPQGEATLRALRGGVVGGAPVRRDLAAALSRTRLRAGYGLTEASPGVCLGAPGDWREGWLGEPIGCDASVADTGELLVRGPNVCAGRWDDGLTLEPANRWLATGDLVERAERGFIHRGRIDHRFKLENGRMIDAPDLERRLRETLPQGADPVLLTANGRDLQLIIPPGARGAAEAAWPDSLPVPEFIELVLTTTDLTPKGEPDRPALARRLARVPERAA